MQQPARGAFADGRAMSSEQVAENLPTPPGNDCNHTNGINSIKQDQIENDLSPASPNGYTFGSPPSILLAGKPGVAKRTKRVSFANLPENRRFSTAAECLDMLKEGCELIKTKKTGKVYRRYYYMDECCMEIKWLPTQKKLNKNKIIVSQIKEVLKGEFEQDADGELLEECAFTIVHGPQYETLSLVAKSAEIASVWVTGLLYLLQLNSNKVDKSSVSATEMRDETFQPLVHNLSRALLCPLQMIAHCRWLSEAYMKTEPGNDGKITTEQATVLIRQLNPTVSCSLLELKIKEIVTKKESSVKGFLDKEEFLSLYKDVSSRQEVYFLLARYSVGLEDCISAEGLQEFLQTEQCLMDVSLSYCSQLIQEFEPSAKGRESGLLGIDGFQKFLLCESHCDIFKSSHRQVCQDMTQPLDHYFIFSSHKSYLAKDQLKGPSRVANYGHYLRKGCRYLEVECWDGDEGKPIVYHGNTFTSQLNLDDVLKEIKDNAFTTSEYPVILCVANHCSLLQQDLLAAAISDHLGPFVYKEPLSGTCLPSPQELKGKIIIKSQLACPQQMVRNDDSIASPVSCMVQLVATQLSDNIAGFINDDPEDMEPSAPRRKSESGPVKQHPLSSKMAAKVCISSRIFEAGAELTPPANTLPDSKWEMWSMSESVAINMIKWSSDQLIWESKKSLMAVFPSSSRVDSTNYNPVDMWNHGIQVVALNHQTAGQWLDLYNGYFQQNGACGYALKPSLLTQPNSYFSLQTSKQTPGTCPSVLQIKVISGHQFPKPVNSTSKGNVTDPCVILKIFGVPADTTSARTKTVPGNGLNPFFDEDFSFYTSYPDLALVRFVVLDDEAMGDEFIAQYTLPYRTMQTGYRYINLLSRTGEPLPNCCLFVHIKISECANKKPLKQGLSRLTIVKDSVNFKDVHVKSWDDSFKACVSPLGSMIELRYGVQLSFAKLQRACDLKEDASLKQCLRVISNRVASSPSTQVKLVLKEKLPLIITEGICPDMLRKAIQAHQGWVNECSNLVENVDRLFGMVKSLEEKLLKEKSTLETEEGAEEFACSPVPRKHAKVIEAVGYNMLVLNDHLSQMAQMKTQCSQELQEVETMFEPLGISIIS